MLIRHQITIDDEANAQQLVDSFRNGNKKSVVNYLATDHAGLTGLVLHIVREDESMFNEIVNGLINDRMKICQ